MEVSIDAKAIKEHTKVMYGDTEDFNIFCIGAGTQTTINRLEQLIQDKYSARASIFHQKAHIGDMIGSRCDNRKLIVQLTVGEQIKVKGGIAYE